MMAMITIVKVTLLLLFCTSTAFVKCSTSTRSRNESNFILDKTWPDLATVQSLHFHGSAVAVDWNNNLIVLHRGSFTSNQKTNGSFLIKEDIILIVDADSGKILATWGGNKFVKPHGIEVTGKCIFITDVKLHQVFKFPHDPITGLWKRDPLIVLGEERVAGNDHNHFCGPTDVAVLSSTEDIYVADGYCNSRIVQFSKDGSYRGEFGAGTSHTSLSSGFTAFNVTHSITIAETVNKTPKTTSPPPLIFVADRNNGRIQTFLENGTFLYEISYEKFGKTPEMILSVTFSPAKYVYSFDEPYGTLYAVVGHLPVGESKVFEILVGKTGYHFRSSFPFSDNPKNEPIHNANQTKENVKLETPHDIAASKDGNVIFVIESQQNLIVKKFIKLRNVLVAKSIRTSHSKINNVIIAIVAIYAYYILLYNLND